MCNNILDVCESGYDVALSSSTTYFICKGTNMIFYKTRLQAWVEVKNSE